MKKLLLQRVFRTLIKNLKDGDDSCSAKGMFLHIADNLKEHEKEWDLIERGRYDDTVLSVILRKTPYAGSTLLFDFIKDRLNAYFKVCAGQKLALKDLDDLHDEIVTFLEDNNAAAQNKRSSSGIHLSTC